MASEAFNRVTIHEHECAIRYGALVKGHDDLKSQVSDLGRNIGGKFDKIHGLLWTAASGSIAALVTALGAVIFYLLTKGHGP